MSELFSLPGLSRRVYDQGKGPEGTEGRGMGRRLSCGYLGSRESVNEAVPHHFLQALSNQASQNQGHAMPSGTQHCTPAAPREAATLGLQSSHPQSHKHHSTPAKPHLQTTESHKQPCPRRTPPRRSIWGGHGIWQEWNGLKVYT